MSPSFKRAQLYTLDQGELRSPKALRQGGRFRPSPLRVVDLHRRGKCPSPAQASLLPLLRITARREKTILKPVRSPRDVLSLGFASSNSLFFLSAERSSYALSAL